MTDPVSASGGTFSIQLPDGRVVKIQAGTPEEAAKGARLMLAREEGEARAKEPGVLPYVDNLARQAAGAASMNFADEVAAGLDALLSRGSGASELAARYSENLASNRAQNEAFSNANPVASFVSNAAGAVGGTLATLPTAALRGASTMLGNVVKGGLIGTSMGGISGFGEGEGGLLNRLNSGGKGAAWGGAAGMALAPVATALGGGYRYIAESPGVRAVADTVGRTMTKIADALTPPSLPASAPKGGIAGEDLKTKIANALRKNAPGAREIIDDAAAHRIALALRRGGSSAEDVRKIMAGLGEDAMLVDTTQLLQRLARSTNQSESPAARIIDINMAARNMRTESRVGRAGVGAFGDNLPAVKEIERLRGQLKSTREDYLEADAAGLTVSREMQEVMNRAPAIKESIDALRKEYARTGQKVSEVELYHKVKRDLNENAIGLYEGNSTRAKPSGDLATEFETALLTANPKLRLADARYKERAGQIEAFDLGRKFMTKGISETADAVSPAALADRIKGYTPDQAKAFISGMGDTFATRAADGPDSARALAKLVSDRGGSANIRNKIKTMIGDDNAEELFKRANSEGQYAKTDRTVRGNSIERAGDIETALSSVQGGVPTSTSGLLSSLWRAGTGLVEKHRAGNEAVRERIARALTETNIAANSDTIDLIAKALGNVNRSRIVERGSATAAGSTAVRNRD